MTFTVTYDTNHSKSVLVRVAHQVFGETFQTSDSNFSVSFEHHRIKVVCADVMSEADQTLWLQYLERIFAGSDIQLDTTGDDRWLRELQSVNVTGYHHKEDGSQASFFPDWDNGPSKIVLLRDKVEQFGVL